MYFQLRSALAVCAVAVMAVGVAPRAEAVDVILQMGVHSGGDELAGATFTSGDSDKIKAGELLSFAAGIVQPIGESWEVQAGLGWKFDTITATNGDITFDRYPLDLLLFYRPTEKFRIGLGGSYHLNPKLSSSGAASGLDVEFDNALGFAVEAGYFFGHVSPEGTPRGMYLGVNYTAIDYTVANTDVAVDGNSIGLILGFRF
jgi:hypothetical protein